MGIIAWKSYDLRLSLSHYFLTVKVRSHGDLLIFDSEFKEDLDVSFCVCVDPYGMRSLFQGGAQRKHEENKKMKTG